MIAEPTREVRRRAARGAVRMRASFGTSTHVGHEGELVDASPDGAFVAFALDDPFEPELNATVHLGVFVGGEGHVVEGRVRWVGTSSRTGERGMGIAFVATSAYEAEALAFALSPAATSGVYARPSR